MEEAPGTEGVLGLIVDLKGRYAITSNHESVTNIYDIMMKPLNDRDPAFIIEFKKLRAVDRMATSI